MTSASPEHPDLAFLKDRRWFATATVNLSTIGAIMASTMVNVALPDIMGAFAVGQDIAHWLSTGFLSAMTVCLLLNAWLMARLGPQRTYLLAVVVFTVASFIGLAGTNIETVILSRVLQGAAAGLFQPLALAVVYAAFPPEQRGIGIGIFGMGVVMGPAFGPAIGGVIVDHFGWEYSFVGALPVCLLGGVLCLSTLPHSLGHLPRRPFNWVSFALIVLAVSTGLTSLSNGQRLGWNADVIVVGFFTAALAFLAFVIWEMLTDSPLLQVRLFTNPMFAISSVVGILFGAGMFGSLYLLPLFVRTVQHFTATKAGLFLMPSGLILVLVFPIAGRIAQHSSRGPIVVGLLIFGGSNLLMVDADANMALLTLILLSVIGRSGLGLIMPSLNLQGLRTLSPELMPYGPGTLNFVRMLGAAAGVNATSVLLDRRFDLHRDLLKTTQTADNSVTQDLFQRLGEYLDAAGLTGVERLSAMIGYLRQTIDGQANALAFQDAFLMIGIVFMLGLLPAFFMGRKEQAAGIAARPAQA
ncbi:MAG: DHA2 family efflux MFS transporter permease subunit [Alphaproteobacteria bacterium]|nr:DHA2 family efflux MFS transporter permease subunit [Alphaproteobacteria bacterium]